MPVAVRKVDDRARIDENLQGFGMTWNTITEHDRLDERRPAKIVDVIQRRAGANQNFDHFDMSQMGGGNQRGAVIPAGDVGEMRRRHRRVE